MPDVKLKYEGGEWIAKGTITLGRTSDNTISFPEDPNISRNHAEIEQRGDYYCLTDLGSSNGTTVSGQPVTGEFYLWDGAEILLGGSAKVEVVFLNEDGTEPERQVEEVEAQTSETDEIVAAPESQPESTQAKASGKMLLLGGAVFGLAAVFAIGGTIMYLSSSATCSAEAVIISPEVGDALMGPTEIEIDVTNSSCVAKAVFAIDGIEFASSEDPPFSATIDPSEYPEFSDGYDHGLTVILEDVEGNRLTPTQPVLLAFETRAVTKPKAETEIAENGEVPKIAQPASSSVSLIDIHEMSKRLIKQFPANANYNVSNRQLLQEIQKRTADYAKPGYFDRAARYRDAINVGFVREQNLDAPLGFILAMSRSQFMPEKQGSDEGIWRMTDEFAVSNGYKGLCGEETLLDPSQNCASKAAAIYMKSLVFSVFEGDVLYSVAAFGKSPQDAGAWKSSLPPNRSDISSVIRTAAEREQIVRFLAAGIVSENPQKFGLTREKPLSELYRVAL
jgi:pSer/pThr/pTyr-binding forkhead associated (FHA) protein